jgi:hypothetical protein
LENIFKMFKKANIFEIQANSFRHIAVQEYAECLGKQEDLKFEQLQFLIDMLPTFNENEPKLEKKKEEVFELDEMVNEDDLDSMGEEIDETMNEKSLEEGIILTEENQDGVIAILTYLKNSNGKFGDKLFPKVFSILNNL